MTGESKGIVATTVLAFAVVSAVALQLRSAQASSPRSAVPTVPVAHESSQPDNLGAFAANWRRGEYAQAREIASAFDDPRIQHQALELVAFGQAVDCLRDGQVEEAARIAGQTLTGEKKALVQIAVGAFLAASGESTAAAAALEQAISEARANPFRHRAQLLAMASRAYSTFDRARGERLFAESLQAHRPNVEANPKPQTASPASVGIAGRSFYEIVRANPNRTLVFPLHPPGVEGVPLDESLLANVHSGPECTARANSITSIVRNQ